MKYSEAVRLLEENPNNVVEAHCVFKGWIVRMSVVRGISRYFHFEVLDGGKVIDQSLPAGAFNGNVALGLDWQLVQQPVRQPAWQPVPWQEAIQAWAEGKTVTVSTMFGLGSKEVKKSRGSSITEYEITAGTWYVED